MKYFTIFSALFFILSELCVQAQTITPLGKIIDSDEYNFRDANSPRETALRYGYAPTIKYIKGKFHMCYCSTGTYVDPSNSIWSGDVIRYVQSNDGRVWTNPKILLQANSSEVEVMTCDPEIVYFKNFYYLFYSGQKVLQASPYIARTVEYVSRSSNLEGPYYKLTHSNSWVINEPNPKIILSPKDLDPYPDIWSGQMYGAGQLSVVAKDGKLYGWYTDDTRDLHLGQHKEKIVMVTSMDAINWTTSVETNVQGGTKDVKYNPLTNQFEMYGIDGPDNAEYITKRVSSNGILWSDPQIVVNQTQLVNRAANIGVSSDRYGNIINNRTLMVYTEQNDQNVDLYNHITWDMYGHVQNPAGQVWNKIHWGWEWPYTTPDLEVVAGDFDGDKITDRCLVQRSTGKWWIYGSTGDMSIWAWTFPGMTAQHDIAVGDYDGDGKTDRAIVNRSTGQWWIIGSSVGNMEWGWKWNGMGSHHTLALGDYDGDKKTDKAIVDRATGEWWIIGSSVGAMDWGWKWNGMGSQHTLALGDYDGDKKTDKAIVDRATGEWWIIGSSVGAMDWAWKWNGMGSHHTLALGDYDGDGKTDKAIVEKSTGQWYVIGSQNGMMDWGWQFPGLDSSDKLAIGDYDGDKKTDKAIVTSNNRWWYIYTSSPFQIYNTADNSVSNGRIATEITETKIIEEEPIQIQKIYSDEYRVKLLTEGEQINSLLIYDMQGRKVFSIAAVNSSAAVAAVNLTTGIYVFKITTSSNRQFSRRFFLANDLK